MAKGTKFTLDPEFERKLLGSTSVGEVLQPLTARVAARVKTITRYRGIAAGVFAQVGIVDGKHRGRVGSDDMKTGWAEFGTARIPQERALGRALEEVVGPIVAQGGTDA